MAKLLFANLNASRRKAAKSMGFSRIFRYSNLVRRIESKWAEARHLAKRVSKPIKGFTKAWESEQLVDYELDGTQSTDPTGYKCGTRNSTARLFINRFKTKQLLHYSRTYIQVFAAY